MIRRVLLALATLALAALPASAQQVSLPDREFPNFFQYLLFDPSLQLNGLDYQGELYQGERQYHLRLYPSWLTGPLTFRQPLAQARWGRDFMVTAGVQSGGGVDPFFRQSPFRGATLEGDLAETRVSFSAGETVSPFLAQAGGSVLQNRVASLGLTRRVGLGGYGRLALSHWNPTQPGGRTHTMASLEVDPNLLGDWQWSGAVGYDFRSLGEPLRSDRLAWRFDLDGLAGPLEIRASNFTVGAGYGPLQTQGNLQGTSNLNVRVRYPITDRLEWTETYLQLSRSLGGPGVPTFASRNLLSSLRWQADDRLLLELLRQDVLSGASGQPSIPQTAMNARASYLLTPKLAATLGWQTQQTRGASTSESSGLQGGLTWYASDATSLNLVYSEDRFTVFGLAPQNSRQLSGGFTTSFGERGYLNFGGGWFQPGSLLPGAEPNQFTTNASGIWRPGFRWELQGNYNRTFNDASLFPENYRLSATYLVDEHHEVGLTYNRGTLLGLPLGLGAQTPTFTWMAEVRQSFGGPMAAQFRTRHQAVLRALVRYRPGGSEAGEFLPLEGAPVTLGSDYRVTTNAQGVAEFSGLDPGSEPMALDLQTLGPNYEPLDPAEVEVDLAPGSRAEREFRVTAWASVEGVVWNDYDSTGRMPIGYQPYEKIPVRVGDREPVFSDALGYARVTRLPPGRYEISIPPELMPRAVATTGQLPVVVELKPGENKVIPLGVQAVGRLVGQVKLIPPMSTVPGPLPDPITIRNRKLELGRSAPDGTLDLRVPAGNLELDINPQEVRADLYLVNPEVLNFTVEPDEVVRREIVLAPYATLTARVRQGGRIVPQSGVAVQVEGLRFIYTNEEGTATFRRLKAGTYRVSVEPSSLPAGTRLVRPEPVQVRLLPGQAEEFFVDLTGG